MRKENWEGKNTSHRYMDLPEHLGTPPGIQQCNILRSGHNHSARDGDLLRNGELCVSGTWGQVDHQYIQLAPVYSPQQLLYGGHHLESGNNHHTTAAPHSWFNIPSVLSTQWHPFPQLRTPWTCCTRDKVGRDSNNKKFFSCTAQ